MTLPGARGRVFQRARLPDWQPVRSLPNHACATAGPASLCQAMAVVSTSPLAGNAFTAGCTPLRNSFPLPRHPRRAVTIHRPSRPVDWCLSRACCRLATTSHRCLLRPKCIRCWTIAAPCWPQPVAASMRWFSPPCIWRAWSTGRASTSCMPSVLAATGRRGPWCLCRPCTRVFWLRSDGGRAARPGLNPPQCPSPSPVRSASVVLRGAMDAHGANCDLAPQRDISRPSRRRT